MNELDREREFFTPLHQSYWIMTRFGDLRERYGKDYNSMCHLLKEQKYNCLGVSEGGVAAIARLQQAAPPGYQYGLQGFDNHIQLVLFRKAVVGFEVQDLVSGNIKDKVVADIYDLKLFYAAFLLRMGIEPPVKMPRQSSQILGRFLMTRWFCMRQAKKRQVLTVQIKPLGT